MKLIFDIKSKLIVQSFAAILLGSASLASVAAVVDSDAIVQTAGGVPYVSGGIGTESLDQLNSLAGKFNLKLVFALKSGEYLSDVKVAIADLKGKTLLDITSDGPWLYTRLPAGNYQIVATVGGKALKRQVAVGAAKLRTVDFRWAAE